jgi:hypothetical protein
MTKKLFLSIMFRPILGHVRAFYNEISARQSLVCSVSVLVRTTPSVSAHDDFLHRMKYQRTRGKKQYDDGMAQRFLDG